LTRYRSISFKLRGGADSDTLYGMTIALGNAKRRTRPPKITRDEIVNMAIVMLDEDGILSMPKLAQRLDVTTMALYRHVDDREDLDARIVDLAFRNAVVHEPGHGDWKVGVECWMRDLREHWLRHPWLGSIFNPGAHVSPGGFAMMSRLVRVLERAGFDSIERAQAAVWISRITVGLALLENHTRLHVGPDPVTLVEQLSDESRAQWQSILPEVVAYTTDEMFDDAVLMAISALEHQRIV
jgi:AcrR family transcriptional regulator